MSRYRYIATTRKDFEKFFRAEFLPLIKKTESQCGNGIDAPLRREEWNNLIDVYVQDKQLPKYALDWSAPW